MTARPVGGARRVTLSDPLLDGKDFDYTDAFVADLGRRSAEIPQRWMGSGLGHVPLVTDVTVWLRGEAHAPRPSDGLRGWRIMDSTESFIHLEYRLPLMDVTVVGRNVAPASRMVSTGLTFRRRRLAGLVWAVAGPVHRAMSRRLVAGRLGVREETSEG